MFTGEIGLGNALHCKYTLWVGLLLRQVEIKVYEAELIDIRIIVTLDKTFKLHVLKTNAQTFDISLELKLVTE